MQTIFPDGTFISSVTTIELQPKPILKLYIITQSINDDYDTFDSAIVAAYSSEEAKQILPQHNNGNPCSTFSEWAPPEYVSAEIIGSAADNISQGQCILASFNAG